MRKIIVAVVAAVALGLGLVAVPAGASTTATSSTTLHYSSHWAGYAALAKSGSTVKSFTAASAVFTVPSLNCQATPNATVMQLAALGVSGQPTDGVGVIESCHNGSADGVDITGFSCGGPQAPNIPIFPSVGDTVSVSITPAFRHSTLISYDDVTTGDSQSGLISSCVRPSPFTLAGVFTYGSGSGSNIADFAQVGFRQVQVNGHPLGSTAWNVGEYVLKGPSGKIDVKPEALLNGKYTSAFANDWKGPN